MMGGGGGGRLQVRVKFWAGNGLYKAGLVEVFGTDPSVQHSSSQPVFLNFV